MTSDMAVFASTLVRPQIAGNAAFALKRDARMASCLPAFEHESCPIHFGKCGLQSEHMALAALSLSEI